MTRIEPADARAALRGRPDLVRLAAAYDTDKSVNAHYLRNYEDCFGGLVDEEVRLLELGVKTGGSLLLWRDYFPRALVVGLDVRPVTLEDPTGRIRTYQGRQEDTALLDRIGAETAPEGFDVIIDDCSHVGALSRISFWHLFDHHLKSGGVYAIEDWGTGYWDRWADGAAYRKKASLRRSRHPSHDFGMVGFVKELVDECGMGDVTHPRFGIAPHRPSKFREMRVSHGHVLVIKA